MKQASHAVAVSMAAMSLLPGVAATPAGAGEAGNIRIPTAPILHHACMSGGGHTEYDSAAFTSKNPGPDLASHTHQLATMATAFDAWLTQKHNFHGLAQCFSFGTQAEANDWLRGRKQHVEQLNPVFNPRYFATDWSYQGGTVAAAAPQPAQPAAQGAPKVFWFCTAIQNGVGYDSGIFEAPNDITGRRAQFAFAAHLSQQYKFVGGATCRSNPTLAGAQSMQQAYAYGAYSQSSNRIATGWVYQPQ